MDTVVLEVYGESEYIINSLKFVAQIFSFNDYKVLVTIFVTVGLFSALIGFMYKVHTGFMSVQLLLMHFVGASIILTMCLIPKSTVNVHDLVKNRFEEVYKVPTALAYITYMTNNIENGLKEMVAGAAGPINDPTIVGKGEGLELQSNMTDFPKDMYEANPNLIRSLKDYMNRCIRLELSVGRISLDSLTHSQNLWSSFASDHKSAFATMYHITKDPVAYTCENAYKSLTTALNATATTVANSFCEKNSYADPVKCKGDVEVFFGLVTLSTITYKDIIINMTAADAFAYVQAMAAGRNPQEFGANQAYAKSIGGQYQSAVSSGKWVPAMMGMYRGVLIALFPLVLLFAFIAPKKTVMWYLGGFMVILMWSVLDTLLLSFYLSALQDMNADIPNTGMGVQQILAMPNRSMQILTQYGSARWGAMGLATAMTVGILGLSGHAISNIAASSAGSAESAAKAEGAKYSGVGGDAAAIQTSQQTLGEMYTGAGLKAMSNEDRGWMAQGAAHKSMQEMWSGATSAHGLANQYGGDRGAGVAAGEANLKNTVQTNTQAAQRTVNESAMLGMLAGQGDLGGMEATIAKAQAIYGNATPENVQKFAKMERTGGVFDKEAAQNLQKQGFNVQAGDKYNDLSLNQDGTVAQMKTTSVKDGITTEKTLGAGGTVSQWRETGNVSKDNIEALRKRYTEEGKGNLAKNLQIGDKITADYGQDGLIQMQTFNSKDGIDTTKTYGADGAISQWTEKGNDNGLISNTQKDANGKVISQERAGVLTEKNIESVRKDLRAAGLENVAEKVAVGDMFNGTYGENGLSTARITSGGDKTHSDIYRANTGKDIQDVDRDVVIQEHGSGYVSDKLVQAVSKGGSSEVARIADLYSKMEKGEISKSEYEAERNAFSASLAQGIGANYRNSEQNNWGTRVALTGSVGGSANLGVNIFGTGVSVNAKAAGSATVDRSDSTQASTNSIYNDLNNMIDRYGADKGELDNALKDRTTELMSKDNRLFIENDGSNATKFEAVASVVPMDKVPDEFKQLIESTPSTDTSPAPAGCTVTNPEKPVDEPKDSIPNEAIIPQDSPIPPQVNTPVSPSAQVKEGGSTSPVGGTATNPERLNDEPMYSIPNEVVTSQNSPIQPQVNAPIRPSEPSGQDVSTPPTATSSQAQTISMVSSPEKPIDEPKNSIFNEPVKPQISTTSPKARVQDKKDDDIKPLVTPYPTTEQIGDNTKELKQRGDDSEPFKKMY